MGPAFCYARYGTKLVRVQPDVHPEVGAALADGIAEGVEREGGIFFRIGGNDVLAAPSDKLVESQVLEMAAIGEVDEPACVIGIAYEFVDQVGQSKSR